MARSVLAELWVDGYAVKFRNPWSNPRMQAILRAINPAKAARVYGEGFRRPPPWARVRDWVYAGSPYQLKVWETFGELNARLAEEYKSLPKYERLEKRLLGVRTELKGRTFGRKPKIRTPALPTIKKLLGTAASTAQTTEAVAATATATA